MNNGKKEENLEISMLELIKSLLTVKGYSTKCKTAQQKIVQENAFDTPKCYWCCWVTNRDGDKFFAMFDGKEKIKYIPI